MPFSFSMKRVFLVAKITLLAACAQGGGSISTAESELVADRAPFSSYVIVGDSLMDLSSGGELTTTASLILLEEEKSVINISLSGQTMAGYLGKGGAQKNRVGDAINFLTTSKEGQWYTAPGTAVIIELAHNDWYASTPADDFYDSYVKFLKAIDRERLVVVFCVVPIAAKWDYNGRQNANGVAYEQYREIVRKIAKTGLCDLIETSDWFTEEDVKNPSIMTDGVHLAQAGHRKYKDRLIQEMMKY
jgi:lysophospholipase L1-like esterase